MGHTPTVTSRARSDGAGPVRVRLPELRPEGAPPALVFGDLSLVRPLAMAGIPVVVLASDPGDPTLRSRHAKGRALVPPLSTPEGMRTLLALGDDLRDRLGRRPPLYYGSDAQLEAIYREREAVEERFALLLNEPDLAWALFDKARFYALCEERDVEAPRSVRPGEELASATERLRAPLVVKPRSKESWHGLRTQLFDGAAKARTFESARALLATPGIVEASPSLVIQELVPSEARDLFSFHGYVDEHGELLACFSGRKIRTYPAFGGESAFIETVDAPAVEEAGRRVAERLGLRGAFKIDFVRDPRDGRLVTLEVNARYTLWCLLGAAHGVNLPAVAYEHLVRGRRPPFVSALPPRVRWLHGGRDVLALREARRDGDLDLARWVRSTLRTPLLHDVFAWNDPAPFVFSLARRARAVRKVRRVPALALVRARASLAGALGAAMKKVNR